ncbi:spore germination protein [Oceanirhabdus sp. W0125-5]|uniref:spore germination protein n=1 Tax=Oceanirhabdus sp. W0125-5 TaxID=2999116 RepID=UPI0022F2F783|nr:spore germination protein [Oceanirhabdus sp. W0125-5]WBW95644.1 spore germination protein [Oceanirhabdus sp. W0125-5]
MSINLLSKDLEKNIDMISAEVPENYNFIKRKLVLKGEVRCSILYLSGIAKRDEIEERIIEPLLFQIDCDIKKLSSPASYLSERYIIISSTELSSNINYISEMIKGGNTVVLLENEDTAIICSTYRSNFKKAADSKIEETIRGEKSAFVEVMGINISLLQEKLKNKNFKIEKFVLGEENKSEAALIYMDNIIDKEILNKLRKQIEGIKTSYLPDTGYLAQFIDKKPFSIFPQSKTTEKPDKVVSDLLQGKAALLLNGCSYVVVFPVVFIEFFQGFEDYSNRFLLSSFDRILRLMAVLLILTLSPIYLVLLKYNIYLIPLDLIKIIVMSRKDIPLPPFLEILLMEIIIEFLREGGLRLPSVVGQTLSIVGGIILGSAAIEAGIVSPTTLVVVSITVISTFLIPNYEMSLSIRLLRFYILILAQIFGFLGVIIGLFSITAHLMKLESIGIPYFSPFAPMRHRDLKDSFIRFPLKYINRIPVSFRKRRVKNKK